MSKDEALKLAMEALVYASSYCDTYDAIDAVKQAFAAPVQEPVRWSDYEPDGRRYPTVPDAITDNSESPDYLEGWNDCRQAMMEMMK